MSAPLSAETYAQLDWEVLAPAVAHLVPEWRRAPGFSPWRPRVIPWEQCSEERRRALRRAWRSGDLSYKLDPEQLRVYRDFRAWLERPTEGRRKRGKKYAFDVSRRWGKSTIAFLIAVEERIRQPKNKRIAYWCDTAQMCREIIMLEVFPLIFADCPPEFLPTWYPSRNRIIWDQEGSSLDLSKSLELAGLDNPNRARGRSLHLGIIDEAAFLDKLEYIDRSVLSKMLIGVKGAALLFASTPPVTPAHYWSTTIVPQCEQAGAHHHGTIFDSMRLSDEEIWSEIQESGGIESTTVRRELFAEHTPEETMAVLPEAVPAFNDGSLIFSGALSEWRCCYTSMDPGWGDATGVVFASVDFELDRVIVEDCWLESQAPSSVVAQAILDREEKLWKGVQRWHNGAPQGNPARRFTDIDKRMVADLAHDHKLLFGFTKRDNLHQQINRVRNWILQGRLQVHPRCKDLISQMRNAVFKTENRREFARNGTFGHFDLISSLVILCRNVEPLMARNPNPPQRYDARTHHVPKELQHEPTRLQAVASTERDRRRFERLRKR